MNKTKLFCGAVALLICCSTAWADLTSEFAGFTWVKENKVSGLTSSVNMSLPGSMFTLGPGRVSYPSGIGTVPSPGYYNWAEAQVFDEGGLGVRVSDGKLIVRAAGGLNPQTGYWSAGHSQRYGSGDVFLTIDDLDVGVRNFALLNSWARDASGAVLAIGGTWYNVAQTFHVGGLEGHLVRLTGAGDVALTGGDGAYGAWTPSGLDSRVYAQGGVDMGDALLTHSSTTDDGLNGAINQAFYIQTWTVPLNLLSTYGTFDIGLHQATSCGNDQIGLVTTAPVPGAVMLAVLGFGTAGWRLRRRTA